MNMHKTSPFMIEFIGTPEAGKTTTIHRLKDLLLTQKYSVNLVRESAEIVPTSFPKGSTEAHFWMRLTTARSILENQVSNESDIILIDRGLIDTLFWDTYYGSIGTMSTSEVSKTNAFFKVSVLNTRTSSSTCQLPLRKQFVGVVVKDAS